MTSIPRATLLMPLTVVATAALFAACSTPGNAAAATADVAQHAAAAAPAGYPDKLLWGDQHVHTSHSGDAAAAGTTVSPEGAVRFARGESVKSNTGQDAKLNRALDSIAVTDHSDGMGTMSEIQTGNPEMMADATVKRWHDAMAKSKEDAAKASREIINAQASRSLPKIVMDPKWAVSVWAKNVDTMERYNEPGKFTAFIARP